MSAPYQFECHVRHGDQAVVAGYFLFRPDSYHGFPTVESARKCAKDVGHFGFWRVKGSAA